MRESCEKALVAWQCCFMAVGLTSPVLVGRDGQLAVLEQVFDGVRAGSPGVVLLGGEAGAGKTRLVTEFGSRLAGQAMVLTGGCVDLGGSGLAFAPFTAALRSGGCADFQR